MNHFNDESVEEEDIRNNAFQLLNGLREALSIAKRPNQPIPYKKTIGIIHDFDPAMAKSITELLTKQNESETVKYYKQKAKLESKIKDTEVLPKTLILEDIQEHKNLIEIGEEVNQITKKYLN